MTRQTANVIGKRWLIERTPANDTWLTNAYVRLSVTMFKGLCGHYLFITKCFFVNFVNYTKA